MTARQRKERACFAILVEKDRTGYIAFCPALTGCYGQGISYEDALESVKNNLVKQLKPLLEAGKPMPRSVRLGLAIVEVEV